MEKINSSSVVLVLLKNWRIGCKSTSTSSKSRSLVKAPRERGLGRAVTTIALSTMLRTIPNPNKATKASKCTLAKTSKMTTGGSPCPTAPIKKISIHRTISLNGNQLNLISLVYITTWTTKARTKARNASATTTTPQKSWIWIHGDLAL